MWTRGGVDQANGGQVLVELKSVPKPTSQARGVWWSSLVPSRTRWYHLLPVTLLLLIGTAVPGFPSTFVLLVLSVAVALGLFMLSVQLPVGYLLRYWHELQVRRSARRPSRRRTPSSGS